MLRFRKHSMVSAIALALGVSACGGGGGGEEPGFTPPPPAPPAPPPPPIGISAAAPATAPNANLFPEATNGGPTMQSHATTTFPLLQSVMTRTATSIGASTAANSGGATLESSATGSVFNDAFRLVVPALSFDVTMTSGGYYCYALACGSSAGTNFELYVPDPYTSDLNWTTYGMWGAWANTSYFGAFATGYSTPVASIPTTGTASYTGSVFGSVVTPTDTCITCLSGDASLLANFGTGNITGSLTGMMVASLPWNDVSLTGTISGGVNGFSGTTAVTSAPGGSYGLAGSATGTFAGRFFGPSAQELGAVWTLFDGTRAAMGSIGAKTGP